MDLQEKARRKLQEKLGLTEEAYAAFVAERWHIPIWATSF